MELSLQQVVYKTERGTPVTDSVKVAQVFCKMHKNVLKSIRNLAAQNLAAKSWFHEITYLDGRGQTQPMFLMNRDGFSLLAMSLTGEKALQFKVGFIQQFDAMEAALKEIAPTRPAIPQTFAQALRLAAEQAETIENQERQIEAQRKQLADQEDDVKFVRSLQTADTSIYITDLAKLIAQNGVDIGGIRLFKWMRDNGFLTLTTSRHNVPLIWACLKSRLRNGRIPRPGKWQLRSQPLSPSKDKNISSINLSINPNIHENLYQRKNYGVAVARSPTTVCRCRRVA